MPDITVSSPPWCINTHVEHNWQEIVKSIKKTHIPPELVGRVIFRVPGQEDLVIDLAYSNPEILHQIFEQLYSEYEEDCRVIMLVDIARLSHQVTPLVDHILRGIPSRV